MTQSLTRAAHCGNTGVIKPQIRKENYLRILFTPYSMNLDLGERFLSLKDTTIGLECLVQGNVNKFTTEYIKPTVELYKDYLKILMKIFKGNLICGP